jgi:hypothetical protein
MIRYQSGKMVTINFHPDNTIQQIKEMFAKKEGLQANQVELIFGGEELKGEKTLGECHIQQESVLHLLFRLDGGIK